MKNNYFTHEMGGIFILKKPPFFSNNLEKKNKSKIFTGLFFLFATLFFNVGNAQTFTDNTPGTRSFTVPCDVTSITIQAWGGGGAGGAATSNPNGGSGGGGGGYSTYTVAVTSGQVISYTVGAGGAGGTGNGGNGNPTSFLALTANGGNGGAQNQGAFGTGGTAIGGTTNTSGTSGGTGTIATGAAGGAGGNGGAGGAARTLASNTGNSGTSPGGGGGGGLRLGGGGTRNGGNGADGRISVTYVSAFAAYCVPNFTTSTNPITNVNFAGINNSTSNVIGGTPDYQLFCSPTGTVEQGETYAISISGNTNGNTTYGVTAFFDWNNDGDFFDASETNNINALNNSTGGPAVTGAIIVPIGATIGNIRMRIMMENGSYPTSCRTGAGRGQTEDYTVTVTPVTCKNPTALVASAITATTATVSWTAPAPAPGSGYEYFISTINAAPNTNSVPSGSVGVGINTVNLTGLTPGFTYYIWVRGNCGAGDHSIWSTGINFTTTLNNDNCATSIGLTVNTGATCVVATDGTTVSATQSLAGCTGNADDDVWYSFTATAVSHTVTVIPTTLVNPVFQVFTACGGASLACINADGTATGVETTTLAGLTIGNVYYVRVYSNGAGGNQGTFTICVTTGVSPYCAPSSAISNRYINDYQTVGPLNNTVNLNTGRSATGYRDYTALTAATQIPSGGINIDISLAVSRQYLKAWVDWDNNGTFTDAAPELVYTSGGVQSIATSFGFVIPGATVPGNYRLRVRSYEAAQAFLPCGNLDTGETEDYTITVIADCTAKITSVTDGSRCDTGTVNLVAVGAGAPTQYRWYDAETGGSLLATTATGNWTTPSIATTTTYWVTAFNGCESLVRTKIIAKINPTTTINVTPSVPEVCGENNVVSIAALGDVVTTDLINETFEGGGLGAFTSVLIGGAGDAQTQWQKQVSTYVPTLSVWKPAISSRVNGNGFAFTTSDKNLDVNASLESAVFSTVPFSDLTLTYRHYYSYYGVPYDGAYVEVSTDSGATYTPVQSHTSDQGVATKFVTVTVNLNAYINQPNFRLRFRYNARFCDGWALDDVRLYGTTPLNTTFTWSGSVAAFTDAACTIPYVAQAVTTIYVKPTGAQITSPTWSFTATATLGNGCPVSKIISINNKTKTWQGTTNDWNDPNNWLPNGVPDIGVCVIIPPAANQSLLSAGPAGNGKNLTIKNGGILEIQSGNALTIKEIVDVNTGGTFNIKNNSSLVQIDNVTNLGNINMERIANLRFNDYSYWSSPVGNLLTGTFPVTSVSPSTPTNYIFNWLTTAANANGGQGNWANINENMIPTKGYIVRGANGFNNATTTPLTANFIGVPNNGDFSPTIFRGTDFTTAGTQGMLRTATDDNWNLLGNPYPSSLGVNEFLTANPSIQGFVKIWTHGTLPTTIATDPFYQDFVYNYTAGDYLTINATGATSGPGNYKIGAGQGFMVLMNAGAPGSGSVTFNNTMRSATFGNTQFYKTGSSNRSTTVRDQNRIWLDLVSSTGTVSRTLIGYLDGATQANDRLYDAFTDNKNSQNFYSLINDETMIIQGRSLPFDNNDLVPLGIKIPTNGTYNIAIATADGVFADGVQTVYLEDKLLNTIHNLTASQYQFTENQGTVNDRFVLRYTNNTLSNSDFDYSNEVRIFANNSINISSMNQSIKQVIVYDILGKVLIDKKEISKKEISLNELKPTTNVLIVKVVLENNNVVIKKVIF